MAINVKNKLVTVESLGIAYLTEQGARQEADQALSTRIDNIVAPEGDPSLTEVSDARVSGQTTYNTLKARLDADKASIGTEMDEIKADLEDMQDGTNRVEMGLSEKVDGAYVEDGIAYFCCGDDVLFTITGIGGSGSGSDTALTELVFQNTTGWVTKTMSAEGTCLLSFNWSSEADGYSTGNGTLSIQVRGVTVMSRTVAQGAVEADVARYLQTGSNRIKATITDSYGNVKSIVFTVVVISLTVSSSYDNSQIQTGAFDVAYTVTGPGGKTVKFVMDGTQIGTAVITTSGRQSTYTVPAQVHGAHVLEIYAESTVDGASVESNHLYLTVMCVASGNTTPIIASSYSAVQLAQYDSAVIPYYVYDPSSMAADITITVNNLPYGSLTVDRTLQYFVYRARETGTLTITITCGLTSRTFELTVVQSDMDIYPETGNLVLHLTAEGRANSEVSTGSWAYGSISATMSGFNFSSDGWVLDNDNNTVLRVTGDARVVIPYQIFGSDFRTTGKTIEIEFEAHDVRDYDAEIITCWSNNRGLKLTAQNALLASEQSSISTQYKEDEHVRIAFVVEKRSENRLMYIYINGIMSGVVQYPVEDDFAQADPVGISIGSSQCTVDIYNIRIYDNDLTRYQILTNWIADTQDINEMLARYERNDVYDAYGSIVIDKLPMDLPYMTLTPTGDNPHLPQYKGDKTPTSVLFVDESGTFTGFEAVGAQNNVQGTSSQYYPRKNYKISYKGGFMVNGELVSVYALREGAVPTNAFTYKADVASSEGANNVELARLFNMVAPATPGITNGSAGVRQTIDGFPIVMFHNNGTTISFIGKYNFNNDKGTEEVYGFGEGDESWEIKNNTSDRVRFKSADFTGNAWKEDFEGSYPEDYTDTTNLAAMCGWVCGTDPLQATGATLSESVTYSGTTYTSDSSAYRLAKFRNELSSWFNVENCIAYYLFTEMFLMVDSRAKNAFPTYWASADRWYWRLYDADTAIGINNEGALAFGYELEDTDTTGSGADVFNGQDSVFWNNLRTTYAEEIQSKWQSWRSAGSMSYSVVEQMFESHQNKWPEAIFNEDAYFKYIRPLVEDGDGTYLPMAQGSKTEQRKWWLYNRFRYMDSKYSAGDSLTDYIQLRGYAKDDITLTPYAHMYAAVRFAQTLVKQRALKGSSYVMTCPLDTVNDTEIYIYNASRLASVGDLSGLKVGLADFSRATKLQEIKVGDSAQSYTNGNLTNLVLGNNTLLRVLDARNCVNLAQPVDLSGCINIEELYFEGTAITGLNLPNGGVIEVLHLPDTVTNLTIRNQQKIIDFELDSYSQITTLRLENTSIDDFPILMGMADNGRVRLLGVDWETDTYEEAEELLNKLLSSRGLDEAGNNTQLAQVSGDYHAGVISDYQLEEFGNYPDLHVTYDTQINHEWLLNKYLNDDIDAYEDLQLTRLAGSVLRGRHGTIYFPNVTEVYSSAFNGFKTDFSLRTSLPGLMYIRGESAFYDANLTAADSISLIGIEDGNGNVVNSAFSHMTQLKYAYLPNVISCGENTFHSCSNLEYVIMPRLIASSIGRWLDGCNALKYLEIFGGSMNIVTFFSGSLSAFRHLVIRDTQNVIAVPSRYNSTNNAIDGGVSGAVANVYVARSLISSYQSATNWSTRYSNGYVSFKALEDYTVDGTVTGEFNYELINLEVYHES